MAQSLHYDPVLACIPFLVEEKNILIPDSARSSKEETFPVLPKPGTISTRPSMAQQVGMHPQWLETLRAQAASPKDA